LATANDELPEHVNILFLQTVEQSDLPYDTVSDLSICLSVHLSNSCDRWATCWHCTWCTVYVVQVRVLVLVPVCDDFTALHGMQTPSSDEVSVCLSVRRQTRRFWQNVRKICLFFIPYERSVSPVFWKEEWLLGATTSTWNFGSNWPRWNEIVDFLSVFPSCSSDVTPRENSSSNTNRKSTTRSSTSPRWTSYVVPKPPKGWLKNTVPKIGTIICANSDTVRVRMTVTINH